MTAAARHVHEVPRRRAPDGAVSAWFHRFVRKPLTTQLVGQLAGDPATMAPREIPSHEPTNILLGQAAYEIVAQLPESSDVCARLRAPTRHASRRGQGTLVCEREAVHGRVGATLAALGHPARPARLDTGTTRPGTRSE